MDGRNAKVTARVTEAEHEAVVRIAQEHGVTVSTLIARRVRALVHQHEPKSVPQHPQHHESAGTV